MLAGFVARLDPDGVARTAVDVGAGDGIRGSNTYALFLQGWRGVGFEGDERRARRLARAYRNLEGVEARQALVTPPTSSGCCASTPSPETSASSVRHRQLRLLGARRRAGKFRPRVVVAEINEKIPPPSASGWLRPGLPPATPLLRLQHRQLEELCARHSYALLAPNTTTPPSPRASCRGHAALDAGRPTAVAIRAPRPPRALPAQSGHGGAPLDESRPGARLPQRLLRAPRRQYELSLAGEPSRSRRREPERKDGGLDSRFIGSFFIES